MESRYSFEIFKSNVCHLVKSVGELEFIIKKIRVLHKKWCMNKLWEKHLFHDPLDNEPLAA